MRTAVLFVILSAAVATAQTATSPASAPDSQPSVQPSHYDRGIYLPALSDRESCGTIVSYNFTRGDDPRLKSVTTCTPLTARTPKRAQRETPKPQPRLRLVSDEPHAK